MRGYGEYCPIALGAEVFAERWTPIIIRNLMVGASQFGDILEGAPGIPRSVLSQRLRSLERDGVVTRTKRGHHTRYALTPSGVELGDVVTALGIWGARWREVQPEHRDPYLVLWTLARLIEPASLPRQRIVVRFDLKEGHTRGPDRYWLLLSSAGNEVCVTTPGDTEDGVFSANADWLVRWHTGRVTLPDAQRAGAVTVVGPRWLEREISRWGRLSPFANVQAVTTAARS